MFFCRQNRAFAEWRVHTGRLYNRVRKVRFQMEGKMVAEILFVATLFVTRVVLPVAAMLALGAFIERQVNREAGAV